MNDTTPLSEHAPQVPGNAQLSQTIDASGLNCPLPLLKAKQGLKLLVKGQYLKLIATDPGSVRDFQTFAQLSGNALISSEEQDGCYIYILKKCIDS